MEYIHDIPAGTLPSDDRIEFFGQRATRKVFFMQNGHTFPFRLLSRKHKQTLIKEVINDPEAMSDLRGKGFTLNEALEEYTFCMYGAVDNSGDISGDKLAAAENFRCGENCRCLRWRRKMIHIYDRPITPREIQVLDSLSSDDTDELRADKLGMTRSTLNTHKKNLFNKFGVASGTALISKAITHKVIQ